MHELRLPWLVFCILLPAIGSIWVKLARDPDSARRYSLIASGLALACALAAWWDFQTLGTFEAGEGWAPLAHVIHKDLLVVDELSAPKLSLAALIYFLTNLATLRPKVRDFSFSRSLSSEAILLATLACKLPWGVVALMAAGTVPPYFELRDAKVSLKIYSIHMGLFVIMLCSGQALLSARGPSPYPMAGLALVAGAMVLRSGVAPLHCWMTDLFEHATFGTALLFSTPMVGTYGITRLVLPVAPPWALHAISSASLFTAVYAAGMALVQREARRFFCYLFLSHSSLVLVGIGTATPLGLTGALNLWLSVALSLTGFGLTIRCIESRTGRIPLSGFQGLYHHVPMLAAFFLLTGLASVGFPGTAGFVGLELLVEGTARAGTLAGAAVVTVAALNGLAVMHAYFRIFAGKHHTTAIDLHVRPAERVAVLVLTALILGGGLHPQPGVTSRYHAADELYKMRARSIPSRRSGPEPPLLPPTTTK
jgi:NADH-quinone oxidoreductase subunit M